MWLSKGKDCHMITSFTSSGQWPLTDPLWWRGSHSKAGDSYVILELLNMIVKITEGENNLSHLHKLHDRMLLTDIEGPGFPLQHSRSGIVVSSFPVWLMLSTAAERNRLCMGCDGESSGSSCVDTTFVSRGAVRTHTSVTLIVRDRVFLYCDVPSLKCASSSNTNTNWDVLTSEIRESTQLRRFISPLPVTQ